MDLNQIALPPVFACKWLAICRGMSFYFTSACARSCPVLDPQTLKTNPMCFTALTERIQAGLHFEQGCDFCQHVCLCVSHSCNNNVQLFIISVAMFAFGVVFVVLGFVSFWWFSSLHFVFFLSILFLSVIRSRSSLFPVYVLSFLFCVHAYAYIFVSWEKPAWLHFSGMHLASTPLYIKYAASWKTATYCA